MAHSFAKIFARIWTDGDFLSLSGAAQRMYLLLLSQPNVNHAGVLPLQKRRWAKLCARGTVAAVGGWLTELAERRYVVIDEDTEELLIRTYIRNDEVWKQPNLLTSALREASGTLSGTLRRTLSAELERIPLDEMTGKRAETMKAQVIRHIETLSGTLPGTPSEGFTEPIAEGIGEGIPEGSVVVAVVGEELKDRTSVTLGQDQQSVESNGRPRPLRPEPGSDDDPQFVAFWDAYPRKIGKPSGRRAWRAALKRGAEPRKIAAAAQWFRDDPTRSHDDRFIPHPSSWLNDERYATQGEPHRARLAGDVEEITGGWDV